MGSRKRSIKISRKHRRKSRRLPKISNEKIEKLRLIKEKRQTSMNTSLNKTQLKKRIKTLEKNIEKAKNDMGPYGGGMYVLPDYQKNLERYKQLLKLKN